MFNYGNSECHLGQWWLGFWPITAQPLLPCPFSLARNNIWPPVPLEVSRNATSISPRQGLITVLGSEPPLALSKNTAIDLMCRALSYNTISSLTAAVPSEHVRPGKGGAPWDTFGRRDSDILSTRKSQRLKDQSEKPQRGRRLIGQEKHRGGEKMQ